MEKEIFQKLRTYEKALNYANQGYMIPLLRAEKEELFNIYDSLFTIPCKRNYSCGKCLLTVAKKLYKELIGSQNYKMSKIHELRQLDKTD